MAKIIGNTTTTPYPRPDWNQTDPTKADYIKNKPNILLTQQRLECLQYYNNADIVPSDASAFVTEDILGDDGVTVEKRIVDILLGDNGIQPFEYNPDDIPEINMIDVVIPYEIDGKKVVEIGDHCLNERSGIENIILPNTIRKIGDNVFGYLNDLQSITIGSGVLTIGDNFLANHSYGIEICLPDGVISVGRDFGTECKVVVPDSITTIGEGAFARGTIICNEYSYADEYAKTYAEEYSISVEYDICSDKFFVVNATIFMDEHGNVHITSASATFDEIQQAYREKKAITGVGRWSNEEWKNCEVYMSVHSITDEIIVFTSVNRDGDIIVATCASGNTWAIYTKDSYSKIQADELFATKEELKSLELSGGGSIATDKTLTVEGAAADAKTVGEKFTVMQSVSNIVPWIREDTDYDGNEYPSVDAVRHYVNGFITYDQIREWGAGVDYKFGTLVFTKTSINGTKYKKSVLLQCIEDHYAPEDFNYIDEWEDWETYWMVVATFDADKAHKDGNGNIIHEHYATKSELEDLVIGESNLVVDQTYDSKSVNAQSGIAVAQALCDKMECETGYEDNIDNYQYGLKFYKIESLDIDVYDDTFVPYFLLVTRGINAPQTNYIDYEYIDITQFKFCSTGIMRRSHYNVINPSEKVARWTEWENLESTSGGSPSVVIDSTLKLEGAAADAKAVGERLNNTESTGWKVETIYSTEGSDEHEFYPSVKAVREYVENNQEIFDIYVTSTLTSGGDKYILADNLSYDNIYSSWCNGKKLYINNLYVSELIDNNVFTVNLPCLGENTSGLVFGAIYSFPVDDLEYINDGMFRHVSVSVIIQSDDSIVVECYDLADRRRVENLQDIDSPIPDITNTDEGKVLKVVNGKPAWVTDYVNAEEVYY